MVARSSLLRRPTPGARPARRTSSVVAALPALAPRLVRLARHDYSDRLLGWIVVLALAVLPACGRQEAVETTAAAEPRLTPAQLSFLKFAPVAEVEATSLADLSGTIEFDEELTARLAAPVPGRVGAARAPARGARRGDEPLPPARAPGRDGRRAQGPGRHGGERRERRAAGRGLRPLARAGDGSRARAAAAAPPGRAGGRGARRRVCAGVLGHGGGDRRRHRGRDPDGPGALHGAQPRPALAARDVRAR